MRRLIGWIKTETLPRSKSPGISLLQRAKIALISLLLIAVASTVGVAMMDQERLKRDLLKLTADAGLTLEVVQLHGRAHTPKETLLTVANLKIGTPILGIDLREIHSKISKIGWVKDAVVSAAFPASSVLVFANAFPLPCCKIMATTN